MKILVVDDEEHIRTLYKAELEDEGYEVIIARNGTSAMELFEMEKPDIVTLDIIMPDIGGIELLRRMKGMRPTIPVILCSAWDYRDEFSIWASEAYIMKSADLGDLKIAIKRCREAVEVGHN